MVITKEMVLDRMKDKKVVLLNVLSEDDYLKLRIKGSNSMPLTQDRDIFVAKVETKYGKEFTFITHGADAYCAAGSNAAEALKKKGFKADFYQGGLQDWNEAGLPLEGIRLKP